MLLRLQTVPAVRQIETLQVVSVRARIIHRQLAWPIAVDMLILWMLFRVHGTRDSKHHCIRLRIVLLKAVNIPYVKLLIGIGLFKFLLAQVWRLFYFWKFHLFAPSLPLFNIFIFSARKIVDRFLSEFLISHPGEQQVVIAVSVLNAASLFATNLAALQFLYPPRARLFHF